jgi:hypothetical protein
MRRAERLKLAEAGEETLCSIWSGSASSLKVTEEASVSTPDCESSLFNGFTSEMLGELLGPGRLPRGRAPRGRLLNDGVVDASVTLSDASETRFMDTYLHRGQMPKRCNHGKKTRLV